ncbi:MAG TPA: hypothetical protein VGG32_00710 [Thermoplasmata archaeon]|jgi:hypothetical protein
MSSEIPARRQQRIFYEERDDSGKVVLRQIIGFPTIREDGSVYIERPGNTNVLIRSFHKMEDYAPTNGDTK